MPRALTDLKLDTRNARSKLKRRREPYWRDVAKGAALGYRKGKKGGSWTARFYRPGEGRSFTRIGVADDLLDADGLRILDFGQAYRLAATWFQEQARREAGQLQVGPYTVNDAIDDYLLWYEANRKSISDTRQRANAFIRPRLGGIEVKNLTTVRIRTWLHELATAPARVRSRKGAAQSYRASAPGPEPKRKRRASANRIFTMLRAALNHAWRDGKTPSDDSWRKVKPFQGADSPRVKYLAITECTRLAAACPPDFGALVQAALLTGCRYGELTALTVDAFDPDNGTIAVEVSKSGKPRRVYLTREGRDFFSGAVSGRAGGGVIFLRSDGQPWGKSHQVRPLAAACKKANLSVAVSFHILRHTYASLLAMAGIPMAVIAANLGHSDTRMTERHYAHLAPSYIADTVRRLAPSMGFRLEDGAASVNQQVMNDCSQFCAEESPGPSVAELDTPPNAKTLNLEMDQELEQEPI